MRFCGLLFVESDLLKHIDEKCPFLPHLLHVLYRLRLQSFVRCPFAPQRVQCWVGGFDDDWWLCWRCFVWRSLYGFSSSPPVEWFVSSFALVKWSAFSMVFAIRVVFSSVNSVSVNNLFRNFDDLQLVIIWSLMLLSVSAPYSQCSDSCLSLVTYCSIVSFWCCVARWNANRSNVISFFGSKWSDSVVNASSNDALAGVKVSCPVFQYRRDVIREPFSLFLRLLRKLLRSN